MTLPEAYINTPLKENYKVCLIIGDCEEKIINSIYIYNYKLHIKTCEINWKDFSARLEYYTCVSPAEVTHVTSTFCETAVSCIPSTATASCIKNGLNRKMSITCTHVEPKATKHISLGFFTSQYLALLNIELPRMHTKHRRILKPYIPRKLRQALHPQETQFPQILSPGQRSLHFVRNSQVWYFL